MDDGLEAITINWLVGAKIVWLTDYWLQVQRSNPSLIPVRMIGLLLQGTDLAKEGEVSLAAY